MFREAVTPSAAVPGARRVTLSSGVSPSPLAPVASLCGDQEDQEAAGHAEHRVPSVQGALEGAPVTRGLTSGSVTSCQIVTLTSSVRALQAGVLTPAPMMSTQAGLPAALARTVRPQDTRPSAHAPRPTQVTPLSRVGPSPQQTCAAPTRAAPTRTVSPGRTRGRGRTGPCVCVTRASEVTA